MYILTTMTATVYLSNGFQKKIKKIMYPNFELNIENHIRIF